jgi:hypothetical protein
MPRLAVVLSAALIFPFLSVVSAVMSVAGYHVAAGRESGVFTVDRTNLRGLAVPLDEAIVPDAPVASGLPYRLLARPRRNQPIYEISQYDYVQTLLEAATFFTDEVQGQPRIFVVDQVNPLPFMLGFPPPRGGNLWFWPGAPELSVDEVFGDADYVLLPKYPTDAQAVVTALEKYGDYLAATFPVHRQTPSWTLLSRR